MGEVKKLIIIGSGPAGLSAAIYAARAQLKPLVIGGEKSGGQLMLTTVIENYAGFAKGIMGPELMQVMRQQAEGFGAEIIDRNVSGVDFIKQPFKVEVGEPDKGETYIAEAVIIATGAENIMLGIPGEKEYLGRGVAVCAVCDAAFYRGRKVVVVGGGDAAMEDTLALVKYATKVTLLVRRGELRASRIMQDRVLTGQKDMVEVRWYAEAVEVLGDGRKVTGVKVRDNRSGNKEVLEADGLFLAIGHRPAVGFLKDQIEMDNKGYIKTGVSYWRNDKFQNPNDKSVFSDIGLWVGGYPTMTSVEGVFAAGDNVDFRYRQAQTSAGMGVMAALDAEWWLERRELGASNQ